MGAAVVAFAAQIPHFGRLHQYMWLMRYDITPIIDDYTDRKCEQHVKVATIK